MKEIKHALAELLRKEEKSTVSDGEIEVDAALVFLNRNSALHGNSSFRILG